MSKSSRSLDELYANFSQAGASSRRSPSPVSRTSPPRSGSGCTKCVDAMREMGIEDSDFENRTRRSLAEAEASAARAEAKVATLAAQLSEVESRSARSASAGTSPTGRRSRSREEIQAEMDDFLNMVADRTGQPRAASLPAARRSASGVASRTSRTAPLSADAERELERFEEWVSQPITVNAAEVMEYSRSRSRSPTRSRTRSLSPKVEEELERFEKMISTPIPLERSGASRSGALRSGSARPYLRSLSQPRSAGAAVVGHAHNIVTGVRGLITESEGVRRYYVKGSEVSREEFLTTFNLG